MWFGTGAIAGVGGVQATGGTITFADGYQIHTFTSSGTFSVKAGGEVECIVAAGGGGGGADGGRGGAGGAGGYISFVVGEQQGGGGTVSSPLNVTAQNYTITIGAGGAGGSRSADTDSFNGNNTIFGAITAIGGGRGGGDADIGASLDGGNGGSGGGGAARLANQINNGGTGSQGFDGGLGSRQYPSSLPEDDYLYQSGGGGGASEAGENAVFDDPYVNVGGDGGDGIQTNITGTPTYFAGGGGGAQSWPPGGADVPFAGLGGGGNGFVSGVQGQEDGQVNTGGGGGGGAAFGGNGGSGIVIIRYKL